MSKYEELKAKFEDADDYLENCGCDSCEHTLKDIRAFECAAASMIERAREAIRETCRLCPLATHGCKRCERREECEGVKLLAEMEAL